MVAYRHSTTRELAIMVLMAYLSYMLAEVILHYCNRQLVKSNFNHRLVTYFFVFIWNLNAAFLYFNSM